MWLRLLAFVLVVGLIAALMHWLPTDEQPEQVGSGLVVLSLVNLNIVAIGIFAFLIGRNLIKLIFDRKRKILGSHIRMRLVVAFVGLTLVPTAILFILASGLLTSALEGWFGTHVEAAVDGAVVVARQHYKVLKNQVETQAQDILKQLNNKRAELKTEDDYRVFLEAERKAHELYSLRLVRHEGLTSLEVHNAAAVVSSFSEPELDQGALKAAFDRKAEILFEENEANRFIRVYLPLKEGEVLVVTHRINPELAQALSVVNESFREYKQFKLFKNPIRSGYLLTFTLITVMIVFAAIWFGFYLARGISVPIKRLAEATRSVARGNYDFQIRASGSDEISSLVSSFNKMTQDLKSSRDEAEKRRLLIEAIVGNLAVGVVTLDHNHCIKSINNAASRIWALEHGNSVIGKPVQEILNASVHNELLELLDRVSTKGALEREISFSLAGRELKVLCTAGTITDMHNNSLGTVLLFDDITELSKAQHMAAWREVAQRIAHEIKNPLTPIQLSAQRLARLVSDMTQPAVQECVATIVQHVDSIKRLANEFSNYARMPRADLKAADLNQIISETITPFAENYSNIVFQFIADNRMPEIQLDREQIRRVIINLIDNSVVTLQSCDPSLFANEMPRIVVRTSYERRHKYASFEVTDNGPGIKPADKTKIFEPYFTTKKGGTGLGLAIVTSIVSDHQGQINVYDNIPHGAKFIVQLPSMPKQTTQRKIVNL